MQTHLSCLAGPKQLESAFLGSCDCISVSIQDLNGLRQLPNRVAGQMVSRAARVRHAAVGQGRWDHDPSPIWVRDMGALEEPLWSFLM